MESKTPEDKSFIFVDQPLVQEEGKMRKLIQKTILQRKDFLFQDYKTILNSELACLKQCDILLSDLKLKNKPFFEDEEFKWERISEE